jgi:hypothetical protein
MQEDRIRLNLNHEQQPSQELPQPHRLSGHPQLPPQHSSLGRLRPKALALFLDSQAQFGYTLISVGSNCAPIPFRRGGAGKAAAFAKNRSIMVIASGEPPMEGNEVVRSSMHVPQPSAQFFRSGRACSTPRCSVQPGQAQRSPQVQPEPASETIA